MIKDKPLYTLYARKLGAFTDSDTLISLTYEDGTQVQISTFKEKNHVTLVQPHQEIRVADTLFICPNCKQETEKVYVHENKINCYCCISEYDLYTIA